ncbi:hypothetical protein [Paraburkholderia franconis]|nr:hypothetical protein [Paraburkholderia franconis]
MDDDVLSAQDATEAPPSPPATPAVEADRTTAPAPTQSPAVAVPVQASGEAGARQDGASGVVRVDFRNRRRAA